MNDGLLTVQQFADAAGISKQAVYKKLNNQLKPFVQLVDGKKMLQNKALSEIYGVEVDQPSQPNSQPNSQPTVNQSQPLEALIAMLQKELDGKNEQIAAQARQIEQLTSALENTTSSLQAAQALHAGTMQKQLQPGNVVEVVEPAAEPEDVRPRRSWSIFKRREK